VSGANPSVGPPCGPPPGLTVLPVGRRDARRSAYPSHASSTRNAVVMAAGTTVSPAERVRAGARRRLGPGQGRLADAYNQANTVPNTIYELLLGGVLSGHPPAVLYGGAQPQGRRPDEGAVPAVVTFLSALLVVGPPCSWLCAPFIVDFFLLRAKGGDVAGERALPRRGWPDCSPHSCSSSASPRSHRTSERPSTLRRGRLQPGPRHMVKLPPCLPPTTW